MLKVIDVLSLKGFETFRLITKESGLYNNVSGTGILDWETPEAIAKDFHAEDFVFITLYMSDAEPENMQERFRALFQIKVAAIGIKVPDPDAFALPEEIIQMADRYRIPLFLYTEAYLEDLIFAVRSAVFYNDANRMALDYLRFLMDSGEDAAASIAKKLNPMFHDNHACFCCIPVTEDPEETMERALQDYRRTLTHSLFIYKSGDAFIKCSRCLVIIYTSEEEIAGEEAGLQQILEGFRFRHEDFAIGCSRPRTGLSSLREGIAEARSAALSAFLTGRPQVHFGRIGAEGLIIPHLDSPLHLEFYRRTLQRLEGYDAAHGTHLLETLLCYIDCDGDVTLTAKRLFQHGNTVRYRMDKIKTILGMTQSADAYVQLYMFAKMHRIYSILKDEPLI